MPHMPQEPGFLEHPPPPGAGPGELEDPAVLLAKVENFLASFFEPQCGQGVPCHLEERTRISLSLPHCSQANS